MKNYNTNYLSETAKSIIPYLWETDAPTNALRFDTNTLPSPPPSIGLFLNDMKLYCPVNEYTDPSNRELTKLVADYEGVKPSMITITNSGDEAIDILAKVFINPNEKFITMPPTYDMYTIQCQINRGINTPIPLLGSEFQVNEKKVIAASKNPSVKVIFLCNPNNPTGTVIPEKTIEAITRIVNCIVVVDEAYREFYGGTVVPLIKKYSNLVVLRSLSKFAALAGARIGYLIANDQLTGKFNAIRFPMGVSFLSSKLTQCVLENDREWVIKQVAMIKKERMRLTEAFVKLGFSVVPSQANFLLVNFDQKAGEIYERLKKIHIYIQDRSGKKYLKGYARITVRSQKDNNCLLEALRRIMT